MTDRDAVEERLRAVERAVTDGDRAPADLSDAAAVEDRVDDLARRTTDLEEQVAELDAAVQALRGYVGNIRAVNDDVERRADAALAKVESLARDGGADRDDAPAHRGSVPTEPVRDDGVAGSRPHGRGSDATPRRVGSDAGDDEPGLLDRLGGVL